MENIMQNLPVLITILGMVIGGVIAIIGAFDSKMKDRKKKEEEEENTLSDRIRELYKEESDTLNKRVTDLQDKIVGMEKKIAGLESENKTLREIFQGRDEESTKYRAAGYEAMKKQEKILDCIDRLATTMERYVNEETKLVKTTTKVIKGGVNTHV